MNEAKLRTLADRYLREATAHYREQIAREMVAEVMGDPTISAKLGDSNPSNVK